MSDIKSDLNQEVKKKQSVAEMDAEIKALELEAKRLEVAEKKANLQDLQERLDERQLKRENKQSLALTNGATLKQTEANNAAAQKRCNHRKGGNGAQGILLGQGDDTNYAVLKHTFANGDTWVRCLRCGKTWKPPIRANFKTEEDYLSAHVSYKTALEYQTRNIPSGSIQYRFSDNGEHFREAMANTTLR